MAKHPNCPLCYEVFSEFVDRCLVQDKSLIWPEMERVWTLSNLLQIKENFIDNPLDGDEDFWNKLYKQFEPLNDNCWRILADAFFVYALPSTFMKPERKYGFIKKVCEKRKLDLPDFSEERWEVFNQGFTCTSTQYHKKYKQLWLIILFAINVKQKDDRRSFFRDHKKVRQELINIIEGINPMDRSYGMFNAILHLGYPDYYERMISNADKEKAAAYYKFRIEDEDVLNNGSVDEKLYYIRRSFEENEYRDRDFDFYLPDIISQWRYKKEKIEAGVPEDEVEEDPLLDDLVGTLRRNKQIILYGPPGTGKTYYALKLARTVIAQDNFEKDYCQLTEEEKKYLQLGSTTGESQIREKTNGNEHFKTIKYLRFCTFHPAYGYEEFIEGYRPVLTGEGRPAFKLKNGIFKQICLDAKADPEKTFVLVIDEINRGDIPRIFGELITLIEPDKRLKPGSFENTAVVLPVSKDEFVVPENLLIIGTMNTADKSIALLDIALRRRFGFRELMPVPELLQNRVITGINLGSWLRVLNERIATVVGRDLQVGHSYLMEKGEPVKNEDELVSRIKEKILPLIQEYCFDDYSKLKDILDDRLVDTQQGGFNKEIFTPRGKEIILESLRDMVAGVEEVE